MVCIDDRVIWNTAGRLWGENDAKVSWELDYQWGNVKITPRMACESMRYNPGGHLKKCRSPGQEKCRKSASESAGPKRGAEKSAEKSALGPVSYSIAT